MIKIEYRGFWSFHEKSTKLSWRSNTVETVIVWMYLPEPYNAESEDK